MDLQIKGKKAVVTGGTAGIGLAIAQVLQEEGADVWITGRSKESIAKAGLPGIVTDLGTADGAAKLVAEIPEVDILVNNLGIYEAKPFVEIPDEDWLRLFEVNVLSGVRTSRAYLPGMLQRNSGRIIFISSESGVMTPGEMVHYGMTKSAQLAISRGIAEATKGTGVTVNSVLPGPTMAAAIFDFLKSMSTNPHASNEELEREFFEKHRQSSLLQRLIDPREIGSLVAFVASPLSAATNGAALRAEGGLLRSIA